MSDQPKPVPLFYIAVYGNQVKIRARILGPSCTPLSTNQELAMDEWRTRLETPVLHICLSATQCPHHSHPHGAVSTHKKWW